MFWNKKSGLLHGASHFNKSNSKKGAIHDWLRAFNSAEIKKGNSKSTDLGDLKDKIEKLELLLNENILDKQEKTVVKDEIVKLKKITSDLKTK